MYNPSKYKKRSPIFLYLLIGINSILVFLAGVFVPPLVGIIGLLFGFNFYYYTYSIPAKNAFWREVRLFATALTGVSLGLGLLWMACGFISKPVCMTPKQFNAQVFISFAFTLPFLFLSWLFYRLPSLIRKTKA